MLQSILYNNASLDLFKEAIYFFKNLGFDFNQFTCNKIFDIINKYMRLDGFVEFMVEFLNENGIEQNLITLNTIMDYYCTCKQFNEAFKIFQSLEEKNL